MKEDETFVLLEQLQNLFTQHNTPPYCVMFHCLNVKDISKLKLHAKTNSSPDLRSNVASRQIYFLLKSISLQRQI